MAATTVPANATHASLWEALSAFQGDAPTITKDKTAKVRTRGGGEYTYAYAGLDTVMEAIRPLLALHGLAWYTLPGLDDHGQTVLRYRLVHAATGDGVEGVMPLIVETREGASAVQAMGSAITYARRYALTSVLNLVTDDDDDGQAAGVTGNRSKPQQPQAKPTGPSDAQRKKIRALAREKGITNERLRELARVDSMNDLTPGPGGTASALIDTLTKLPTPAPDAPSDIPPADPGEFEHPDVTGEFTDDPTT